MAGGNYERGLYNQLMEVMERLGKVEREAAATHQKDQEEIREIKDTVARQEKKTEQLTEELERFQSKDKTDSHNSYFLPLLLPAIVLIHYWPNRRNKNRGVSSASLLWGVGFLSLVSVWFSATSFLI